MQYVEGTTGNFRYRWNNYKDNDREQSHQESCMQEHLFKHLTAWDTMVSLTMFQ